MSKRFTDTALWEEQWFHDLPPKYKLFWYFIKDRCDVAGVWSVNQAFADFLIGEEIDMGEALKLLSRQVKEIAPGKWLIIKFIAFQYGRLSENCAPHKAVFALIEKHGIKGNASLALGYKTRQEEEEEEEEDNDKEQDKTKTLLTFPTNGTPKLWHLTEKQVSEWNELYPGVDVLAECRKALAWVKSNRKKTARGMKRFLNGWMGRTNDSQRSNNNQRDNGPKYKKFEG